MMPQIFPVTCHTDHVGPGSTFVAIQGKRENGLDYVPRALAQGATTIIVQQNTIIPPALEQQILQAGATVLYVDNTRRALASLSAEALHYPATALRIIGITGTKGKTTTCYVLEHILRSAGYKTALLSSVANKIVDTTLETELTTQHPDYLHVFFDQCVKAGVDYVIMEVAAQALSLDRVYGLTFDGIIFTNFDKEHGEFYHTLDDYFNAKFLIFQQAKSDAQVLINADDMWGQKILAMHKKFLSFSCSVPTAPYSATLNQNSIAGLNFTIACNGLAYSYACPMLIGVFNGYNLTAAVSMAHALGISAEHITRALITFSGVPGRLQQHHLASGARCFIDKAHNPSSFHAVLSTLRSITDHLIVVFGAGGDRDATKRPLMGAVAVHYADVIILTSDNPRSEDPRVIIQEIFAGIPAEHLHKVIIEVDRYSAIKKAYALSNANSVIALLGKGPDEYELVKGVKTHFSEREIITSLR